VLEVNGIPVGRGFRKPPASTSRPVLVEHIAREPIESLA